MLPPDFKIIDDPRITRVGKILRKTSLDELPQFLNVLQAATCRSWARVRRRSRPSPTQLWHAERLEMAPGIYRAVAGQGRNESTFDERLRMDIKYLSKRSMLFDFRIMLETVGSVLNRSGE